MILFNITDYKQKHTFDFGIDLNQITEIYETMKEMLKQNKVMIDKYRAGLDDKKKS